MFVSIVVGIDGTVFVIRPSFVSVISLQPHLPFVGMFLNFPRETVKGEAHFCEAEKLVPRVVVGPLGPALGAVGSEARIFEIGAFVDDGVAVAAAKEEVPFVGRDVLVGAEHVRNDEEREELLVIFEQTAADGLIRSESDGGKKSEDAGIDVTFGRRSLERCEEEFLEEIEGNLIHVIDLRDFSSDGEDDRAAGSDGTIPLASNTNVGLSGFGDFEFFVDGG